VIRTSHSRLFAAVLLVAACAPLLALDERTDPKQALLDGYRALSRVKSYRVRSTTSAKTVSTTVLEYVAPDRVRMITDRAETIVTPGATFIRYKGGLWSVAPVNVSELVSSFRHPKELDELADPRTTDFKALGAELLEDVQTFVYQYTTSVDEHSTIARVWLGAADGLPRKKETESEYASEKVKSVRLIEYDREISIRSPIR
jgi:hypothetical protein